MKKIVYTKHAKEKFSTKEARKFKINKNKITSVLIRPHFQEQLLEGVIRTFGLLDKDHSLCIVYKLVDDIIKGKSSRSLTQVILSDECRSEGSSTA